MPHDENVRHIARPSHREEIIDIARGFAMLFVCLSHFATAYVQAQSALATADALWVVGMVASPTFVLLSGTLIGVQFATRQSDFSRFRLKLADRAIFLLTVGHVLMLLSILPRSNQPLVYCSVFITDAIAFSVLLTPWLMPRLSGRGRIVLGALLVSLSWLVVDDWQPHYGVEMALKGILFGDTSRPWFPLVPWLGFYLAASVFGEYVAGLLLQRAYAKLCATMVRLGVALITASLLLRGLRWSAVHGFAGMLRDSRGLDMLTTIYQKYPPGPCYALFFGGVGLLLTGGLVELWRHSIATRLLQTLSSIGKSSFFIFVIQAHLYFVVLFYVHLPRTRLWPLLFAITLVPIVVAARWWSKNNMNRYLTVGLPALVAAINARRDDLLRTEG
jgi:uncharacterized membrane protein